MKIGYLRIMEPMQNTSGKVVLCWHRIAWWKWGIWWNPATPESARKSGIGHVGWRWFLINLGRLGCFQIQIQ